MVSGCVGIFSENLIPPANYKDEIAYFPKMRVGDSYVTIDFTCVNGNEFKLVKEQFYYKVTEVKEDGSFTIEIKGDKTDNIRCDKSKFKHYDSKSLLTGGILSSYHAGSLLSFPLFVGKKWKSEETLISLDGKYHDYILFYSVEAFEKVETKAGVFEAFRIHLIQKIISSGWTGGFTYWYSPTVKGIIKSKNRRKGNGELISYNLISDKSEKSGIIQQNKCSKEEIKKLVEKGFSPKEALELCGEKN